MSIKMKNSSVENKKQSLFFSIFKSCEAQFFFVFFFQLFLVLLHVIL